METEVEFIKVNNTRELPQGEWMEMASGCRDRQEAVQAFKEMRGIEPTKIYEFKQTTGWLFFTDKRR